MRIRRSFNRRTEIHCDGSAPSHDAAIEDFPPGAWGSSRIAHVDDVGESEYFSDYEPR
jgi:hypothetical protein